MMTKQQETQADWEQLSLEVEPDLAEELSVPLGEILPGGVVLETYYGDLFPHELDQYQGPVRLIGFYPEENKREIRNKISQALSILGHEELSSLVAYSPIQNRDWATVWQERYRPIPIGENLIIVPTWLENSLPERTPIWMDPGMAFGSGTHPTTQLCLSLLERALSDSVPDGMIDMGCGSGILSITAAKLGVKRILGLDVDPDAVQVSEENARVNGVSEMASFRHGSVQDVLGQERVPLVVANIITPILIDLFAAGLAELLLPEGRLILSGILADQLPDILSSLKLNGFAEPEIHYLDEWVGLIAVNPGTK